MPSACPQAAPVCDAILFKKFKAKLGGRVRVICNGGAPLGAQHVLHRLSNMLIWVACLNNLLLDSLHY